MIEVNFDGLIGPSHNYAGLSFGNTASRRHAGQTSFPKQAALQGLEKMLWLIERGYPQGFFPPQACPRLELLSELGYSGAPASLLAQAAETPELLARIYSSSSMWAANAATITPSTDSLDGKLHLTVANLISNDHRKLETAETLKVLKQIFNQSDYFTLHPPLPELKLFSDEGAANHSRLSDGNQAIHLFCYGAGTPHQTYPSRQTRQASEAIARRHKIAKDQSIYIQQSSEAINAGAFHNDVVAVANNNVLFYHERAYEQKSQRIAFETIKNKIDFLPIEVPEKEVPLHEAIKSYLFNGQLLSDLQYPGEMRLLLPKECEENPLVYAYLEKLTTDQSCPIRRIDFIDVRQSMNNGGGPACLRLRVPMSEAELSAVNSAYLLTPEKIEKLSDCIKHFYPDSIYPQQLADIRLAEQCLKAYQALLKCIGEL